LTIPADEISSGLALGPSAKDVTAAAQTELLLSVSDGVLTIETRMIGPDGPVTVSNKKYRRK
jgi:hypothetical protein